MHLKDIYQPISGELNAVEEVLQASLKSTKYKSILKVNKYLLESPGKMLRPALMILSARACPAGIFSGLCGASSGSNTATLNRNLIKIASAMELIHTASLIHDDTVDQALLRHNRATINVKWGDDVSIALGDYLYSVAFGLISEVGNSDILGCLSSATKAMCEGELIQVIERDNLSLLRDRYIIIIKKKTASLFAASCQVGAILFNSQRKIQNALKDYGLNFGVAFQIIDDYLDLIGQQDKLGKTPGQDIEMGEMTLPLLNLLASVGSDERQELLGLLKSRPQGYFKKIRSRLSNPDVRMRTQATILSYINLAKGKLKALPASKYRNHLFGLADFILRRGFSELSS